MPSYLRVVNSCQGASHRAQGASHRVQSVKLYYTIFHTCAVFYILCNSTTYTSTSPNHLFFSDVTRRQPEVPSEQWLPASRIASSSSSVSSTPTLDLSCFSVSLQIALSLFVSAAARLRRQPSPSTWWWWRHMHAAAAREAGVVLDGPLLLCYTGFRFLLFRTKCVRFNAETSGLIYCIMLLLEPMCQSYKSFSYHVKCLLQIESIRFKEYNANCIPKKTLSSSWRSFNVVTHRWCTEEQSGISYHDYCEEVITSAQLKRVWYIPPWLLWGSNYDKHTSTFHHSFNLEIDV